MGIGIWELVVIFLIVLVIFGTKRLRNMGGDLGGAIRSFRTAMSEGDDKAGANDTSDGDAGQQNKDAKRDS